ncbi:MAG: SDR family oxidoreductase [Deltaproteobacteria bacterium]|nr:SDR family oxidoreductase [Deltaproteobacteria bacterium]MBW2122943.1 SDR family oxidoreductase [Deltaproteobacteria bacterium]
MHGVLQNRNCFLTGATGGLGRCIALQMAGESCNLFLTSRSTSRLKALKRELESAGGGEKVGIGLASGDLNRIEDVERIIRSAKNRFDHIDILINCAGVFPVKSLFRSRLSDFDTCFNVNVRAPFLFSKAFSPGMARRGWGRIVNIGSSSAYQGFGETGIYCASKHALLGLSRSLHEELKGENVRTFCISPGSIKTEMGRKVRGQSYDSFIDPREVARFVAFVISFDGEMISQEIRLNRMKTR